MGTLPTLVLVCRPRREGDRPRILDRLGSHMVLIWAMQLPWGGASLSPILCWDMMKAGWLDCAQSFPNTPALSLLWP